MSATSGVYRRAAANPDEAPGFRNNTSGALNNVGNEGSVWSASANGTNGVYLRFVMNAAQPGNSNNRANGFLLRCLSAFIALLLFLFFTAQSGGRGGK